MEINIPCEYAFIIMLADLTMQSESPFLHLGTSVAAFREKKCVFMIIRKKKLKEFFSRNFTARTLPPTIKTYKYNACIAFMITLTMSINVQTY